MTRKQLLLSFIFWSLAGYFILNSTNPVGAIVNFLVAYLLVLWYNHGGEQIVLTIIKSRDWMRLLLVVLILALFNFLATCISLMAYGKPVSYVEQLLYAPGYALVELGLVYLINWRAINAAAN
jgi:hypothetical protein